MLRFYALSGDHSNGSGASASSSWPIARRSTFNTLSGLLGVESINITIPAGLTHLRLTGAYRCVGCKEMKRTWDGITRAGLVSVNEDGSLSFFLLSLLIVLSVGFNSSNER